MISLGQVDQEQMEKILGYVESGKQVGQKKKKYFILQVAKFWTSFMGSLLKFIKRRKVSEHSLNNDRSQKCSKCSFQAFLGHHFKVPSPL